MGAARLHNIHQILSHRVSLQPCQDLGLTQTPDSISHSPCIINVTPSVTLFDQKVHIKVTGLVKHTKVTIQAWTVTEWRRKDVIFLSYGHFHADQNGEVELDRNPSLGGTYTGVDAMGLFWSLKALPEDPQEVRCIIKDVEQLLEVKLAVFPGHITASHQTVSMETISPICSAVAKRSPKAADVRRIEIEEGHLRGTVFVPPGEGSFPGVIDMFGGAGGIMEMRAALLASHGFATFALPFFRYKDLPRTEADLPFDYFEEAVEWFSRHPAVRPGGVGLVGSSSGGSLALLMAIYCPQVKAVVNINGPPFRMVNNLTRKGKLFVEGQPPDMDAIKTTDGYVISKTAFHCTSDNIFPVWKSSAQILLITCGDDQNCDVRWAEQLRSHYPPEKRHLIDLILYPGAGHLLEPPYTPLCRHCHSATVKDSPIYWGGIPKPHATAQMEAWQRTLAFLHACLA